MVWTSLANTTVKMGEFGVAKSTVRQKRRGKEKKSKGAELGSPGISNPIPGTL